MVEDVVAQLDVEKEAKTAGKAMAAPQTQGKAKKAVVQEEEEEEEEEPEPPKLTKTQRKAKILAQGEQGSGRGQVPQATALPPPESPSQAAPAPDGPWSAYGPPSFGLGTVHMYHSRLRKEEDEKAEQRAKKRGGKPDTDNTSEVKKKKYAVRVEEGFDVEEIMDKILEGHNHLMNLKDVLASTPRLKDELKARLSRKMVASVRLATIIPKEAEWAETGTKMEWKSVACGCLDVVVKGQTCTTMVDSGAKMNLIKEEHALHLGMKIDRSDIGVLMGANSRSVFIGTALSEEAVRNTVLDQEEVVEQEKGDNVIHERKDDDFEEGEIKEAFRAEEYEGVYLELGMLLSCEIRERDACARVLKMRPSFLMTDDHLFMRSKGKASRRVVCGVACQIDVMAAMHDGTAGGHKNTDTTYLKIHELYYWDGMGQMIDDYCKSCVPCQERSSLRPRESLHPRYVREVGAVMRLDLLAMSLGIGSYNFMFDARDNLSGFVDGRVIRTKTGETLARCIEEYYMRYPFVSRFVMDRGSEFTCAEVKTLLKRYGVIAEYTTAAHPQANAPVERGHSTITNLLAKWTDGRPNQWPNFLRVAFFVNNITVRRSTGYAPTTLWYDRHATFPIESFLKTWRWQDLETDLTFEELLDLRARQIDAIEDRIEGAASRVATNHSKDKFRWDKMARVRKESLKVGDIVLLDKRWLRPYRVTTCGEHEAYQIEELNGTTWKDWVSGSRLKKFTARDEAGERGSLEKRKRGPKPEAAERRTFEQGMSSGTQREDKRKEHKSHRHEGPGGSGGLGVPPQPAQMEVDCPMLDIEPDRPHEPQVQDQKEEQSAQEKELDKKERAARDQEIKVQLSMKNLAELHERMQQGKEPEQVDDRRGKGTCTQEEDLPLLSEVWIGFDRLMEVAGRSRGYHQEMRAKLVSTDVLNLRGVMREGFAATRTSDEKVGERLTKVAQKVYGQRVDWEKEVEDLKKELGRQGKEVEAVRADMEKVWAKNEAVRQVNQTLKKVNDVLRAYLQAQQVSFQAKEAESKKRIQNLETKCTRQTPTAVVDWTEVQAFEIRERPAAEAFRCQKEEEKANEQEDEEIPLIDKEMLEPQGELAV
ncbi:hypothetical protein CBR_g23272 [Chara braunii]|uniref:Integrase catalytic domain-containing protein n=1 Tax=Chara braunii TaxID=69332 RepID=A0A388JVD8_CHABU|nr:hypothetical protein CBR_g23272 [Chara braunii]|eukprot:GBG61758.1 hypothetical protein CBR_g23272 [Chara braunii]